MKQKEFKEKMLRLKTRPRQGVQPTKVIPDRTKYDRNRIKKSDR